MFSAFVGSFAAIALVVALVVTGYGLVHAQNTVVERYDIEVDKPGEDMKMVLIGDLHLSVNSRLATTRRMVELINAEQPDVVVIAGDIFTSSYEGLSHPEQYAEALKEADGVAEIEKSVDASLLRDAIDQLPTDMREAILLFEQIPL